MVIAKIIISVVIFGCFVYAGVNLKKNFICKNCFYENLIDFCEVLKTNISFFANPISQIISDNKTRYSKDFSNFLQCYCDEKLNSFQVNYLTDNELTQVKIFINSIGKSGVATEIANIESNKMVFQNLLTSSKEQNKKNGTLCFKLSVCLGLVLVILFA